MTTTLPTTATAFSGVTETDDLPEGFATPPEATAPPQDPSMAEVRGDIKALARVFDAAFDRLVPLMDRQYTELTQRLDQQYAELTQLAHRNQDSLSAPEAGALQHLCEALSSLGEKGLTLRSESLVPYAASVQARSPGGFGVTITIERTDVKVFLTALQALESWMIQARYTPIT